MSLEGKLALVTGGGRGIGKAIALKLASQGADVIVNFFRHRDAAQETANAIEALGVKAEIIRANVGDPAKIDEMFDMIGNKFGRLDILISNAASGVGRPVMDIDIKAWEWTMNINARALLLCTQRAAKLMDGRGGKVVSISSLGSFLAWPTYAVVGVSKAALEALTDVANVVAFLCSEEAFMIRGQTIIVDGGTSVGLLALAGREDDEHG